MSGFVLVCLLFAHDADASVDAPEDQSASAKTRPRLSVEEAERAETEARLRDRGFLRAWLTSRSCYIAQDKTRTKKSLNAELQGARIGGVINRAEVLTLQEEFVVLDRAQKSLRTDVKKLRVKLDKCPPADFKELVECIRRRQEPDALGSRWRRRI